MTTENNGGASGTPEETAGEGTSTETVSLTKSEYEELISTKSEHGSLKRDYKELQKTLRERGETPKETKSDNPDLLQRVETLSMQIAGINSDDEMKLARDLQKETGLPIDKLLTSRYFQSELEAHRTAKANAEATTGIRGDQAGGGGGKQSADYWIAKGEYPTRDQVPDRATRSAIRKALVSKVSGKAQGNFYNS